MQMPQYLWAGENGRESQPFLCSVVNYRYSDRKLRCIKKTPQKHPYVGIFNWHCEEALFKYTCQFTILISLFHKGFNLDFHLLEV